MFHMEFEKYFEQMKSVDYRRYFIPMLGLTYFLFLNNNYDNYYILAFIVFFDSLIILGNFTFLVVWSNAKPLYYEDLYIDVKRLPLLPLDSRRKKIYKKLSFNSYISGDNGTNICKILFKSFSMIF